VPTIVLPALQAIILTYLSSHATLVPWDVHLAINIPRLFAQAVIMDINFPLKVASLLHVEYLIVCTALPLVFANNA